LVIRVNGFLSFLFVRYLVPETKGKTLEQMEESGDFIEKIT